MDFSSPAFCTCSKSPALVFFFLVLGIIFFCILNVYYHGSDLQKTWVFVFVFLFFFGEAGSNMGFVTFFGLSRLIDGLRRSSEGAKKS